MSLLREILVFLCGLRLVLWCQAQVVLPGPCPDVKVMENFDATKYLGKWYEAEKYFFIFELGGKCVTAEYSDLGNGQIGVKNKNINIFGGGTSQIEGEASLGNNTDAKLAVRFPSVPGNTAASYWVVDTDYTSYALVWSCKDLGILNLSFSWILTREQNPPTSVLQKAYGAATKNSIDRRYFLKTDQKDCPANK